MTKSTLKNIIRECLKEVNTESDPQSNAKPSRPSENLRHYIEDIKPARGPQGKLFREKLIELLSTMNVAPALYKPTADAANKLIAAIDANNPHDNIWVK